MRKYSFGFPQIGSPSTFTSPLLGCSWPVMSFMNVLLPAPFGPSSPVIPGGTVTVTSFRPMTWPYHFDTCSALSIGRRSRHHLHAAHAPLEHRDRHDDQASSTSTETMTGVS